MASAGKLMGHLHISEALFPSDLLFFAQQIDPDVVFMNQIPALINCCYAVYC